LLLSLTSPLSKKVALSIVLERIDDLISAERKLNAKLEIGNSTSKYTNEALGALISVGRKFLDSLQGLRDILIRTQSTEENNIVGIIMPLLKIRRSLDPIKVHQILKHCTYDVSFSMHQAVITCLQDSKQVLTFTSPPQLLIRAAKVNGFCVSEAFGFKVEGPADIRMLRNFSESFKAQTALMTSHPVISKGLKMFERKHIKRQTVTRAKSATRITKPV